MNKELFINLIAYCQRMNILSTDENIIKELQEILECSESEIEEILF